jgi:trimethylamine--corrinoid protein Co-methyltransferase
MSAAAPEGRRTRGGAEARRAQRTRLNVTQLPYIHRKIPLTEILNEEGLQLIERNADTILEKIGIEFRDDEEALRLWKEAGADVKGTRVRFPRGLPRSVIQKSAP